MPTSNLLAQKPKTKQDKAHLQAVIRQLTTEPTEIAKNAFDQVLGTGSYDTNPAPQPKPQEKQLTQEEVIAKQKKDAGHMQAFKQELQEIERLQKQREEERNQLRIQEEEQKRKKQEQLAVENQSIVEPVAKKVRGMFGMNMKKKVHDSERRVELPKTPSN